jgi:two-component system response regulator DctR
VSPLVCIIDDDSGVRDSLALLFRSVGLASRSYPDAQAYLSSVPVEGAGCLVLDVRMPGMSGLDLLDALRQRDALLPAIIMTGHADVPMAVRAMKAGALDFLEKPFNNQAMIDAVQRALTHRAAHPSTPVAPELLARYQKLTAREREVMARVVEGKANKVICMELGLSQRTVELHRSHVMEKMAARSLAALVRMAMGMDGASATPVPATAPTPSRHS